LCESTMLPKHATEANTSSTLLFSKHLRKRGACLAVRWLKPTITRSS